MGLFLYANFSLMGEGGLVQESPKFKTWSYLLLLTPQGRQRVPISVKFSMLEYTMGLLSYAKFDYSR